MTSSIYHSVLKPGHKTTEDVLTLVYTPQAVFRVRAVSRCSASIPGHGEAILCTQFSPKDSSQMATGSGDNTARIWDCHTGTAQFTLKGHTSWVLAVSWSPDATMLATGSMDNNVRVWDPKTGQPIGGPLKGHKKWVTALSWEPFHLQEEGVPRLASASKDMTVRIWNAKLGRVDATLSGHKATVSCVKWGGLGHIYTTSQDKSIRVWKTDGSLVHTLNGHAHWVNHLALSTDFVLRTGFYDHKGDGGEISAEGRKKRALARFEKAATVSGNIIERLVTASDDFTIYLWEPQTNTKPIARLQGHQKLVNHVSFSPDGRFIASASFDNHVKLWNGRDGKFINTLRGHVAPVYQCAFSADSRLLVSASKDTTLKVWDTRTQKLHTDLPGHLDEVYAVDWSPDGKKVGSGGKDKVYIRRSVSHNKPQSLTCHRLYDYGCTKIHHAIFI
jgi:ribosome assembly protein 4